jgi:uncharacterized protein YegP (UPF0339 family)
MWKFRVEEKFNLRLKRSQKKRKYIKEKLKMPKKRNYKFEIYKYAENLWRFRILASNGKIVADSGESYRTKYFCIRNANRLKEQLETAPITTKK